jgi:hypothetical protein
VFDFLLRRTARNSGAECRGGCQQHDEKSAAGFGDRLPDFSF